MRFSFQNILTILGDLGDIKVFFAAYENILNIDAIISVPKLSLLFFVLCQRVVELDFTGISGKPAAFKLFVYFIPLIIVLKWLSINMSIYATEALDW